MIKAELAGRNGGKHQGAAPAAAQLAGARKRPEGSQVPAGREREPGNMLTTALSPSATKL